MRLVGKCLTKLPECLDIVRATVKPEQDHVKRKGKERWWRYAKHAPVLRRLLGTLTRS
ncbi:MAG: hypothetical protein IPG04_17480 [Polyangiaceae bacterium]|nr:hypothetical protein [Polyangiaceae bacterium]